VAISFIAGYTPTQKTVISRTPNLYSSISESGKLRYVDLGAQTYYNITAVFEQMSEADKETLMDWLVTNETAEIDLTVGTETYRGYIDPRYPCQQGPTPNSSHLWDLRFQFAGIKQ